MSKFAQRVMIAAMPVALAAGFVLMSRDSNAGGQETAEAGKLHAYRDGGVDQPTLAQVVLDRVPPVRVKAIFDSDDGRHFELEWDPQQSGRLVQTVVLPQLASSVGARPSWRVALWAERTPLKLSEGDNAQSALFEFSTCESTADGGETNPPTENESCSAHGQYVRLSGGPAGDAGRTMAPENIGKAVTATVSFSSNNRTMADAIRGLALNAGGSVQGRSFEDDATAVANDALKLIAEIVIERAQSRAYQLVADMLDELCENIKNPWDPAHGTLLPKTCATIAHVDLHDLASAGKTLEASVAEDLVALLGERLAHAKAKVARAQDAGGAGEIDWNSLWAPMLSLVRDVLAGRKVDKRQAQLLLVEAANLVIKTEGEEMKPVKLAFAAIATCYASAQCDARLIADIINHPTNYFFDATTDDAGAGWAAAEQFVARGLRIVDPPAGTSTTETLKDSIALLADVVNQVEGCKPEDAWAAAHALSKCPNDPTPPIPICKLVDHAHTTIDAIIDGDARAAIVSSVSLIEDGLPDEQKERLKKVSAIVAAIASYAKAYPLKSDGTMDEKGIQANRDARKKAIEGLMDATTDRRQRSGAWVVSLGVNVGGLAGGRWFNAEEYRETRRSLSANPMYPQLSLPMGVAIQKLPSPMFGSKRFGLGFHSQLTVLDLAQYVGYSQDSKVTDPTWSTSLALGAQLGVLIGTSSDAFFIGPEFRYSPTMFPSSNGDGRAGVASIGFGIGYYVPVFDFN